MAGRGEGHRHSGGAAGAHGPFLWSSQLLRRYVLYACLFYYGRYDLLLSAGAGLRRLFKEKGETYFPSVALASCIARYLFLKEIATLNEKYKVKIPLGASAEVDKFDIEFIKKYGENEFLKICKSNFKNYQKIKEQQQEKLY